MSKFKLYFLLTILVAAPATGFVYCAINYTMHWNTISVFILLQIMGTGMFLTVLHGKKKGLYDRTDIANEIFKYQNRNK